MSEIRFWLGMLHRAALKRNDKLLIGNIDNGEPNYIDVSELLAVLTTDDLPESDSRKYISPLQLQKLNALGASNYTLVQLAEYFYPKAENPAGYLTADSALATAKLTGSIAAGLIPNLDAAKIVSGILAAARIPSLNTDKITSGTFHVDRIPLLPASKIEGLALELGKYILNTAIGAANGVVPLDANVKILPGYIPNLDAAKITSGIFSEDRIPDVYVKLAQLVDYYSKTETQAFTVDEKAKLAGLESPKWKGNFLTPAALRLAFPEGEAEAWHEGIGGWTADVDAGVGQLLQRYIWDASDFVWREQASGSGSDTAAMVKSKYESNEDTNAYTDIAKGKVDALPALVESTTGAQAKADAAKTASQNYSDLRSDGLEDRILLNENNKVDKVAGKGLSPEEFTLLEKQKLAAVEDAKWKGEYPTLEALRVDYPEGAGQVWHQDKGGWKADVDAGVGADVVTYLWDASDLKWVLQTGSTTAETATSIKTKYESNADTNAFTDSLKATLEKFNVPLTAELIPVSQADGSILWEAKNATGADLRLSNIVSDLSPAEKTTILDKIGANAAIANSSSYVIQQIEATTGSTDIWWHINRLNGAGMVAAGAAGDPFIIGRSGHNPRPTMIAPFNCVIERVLIGGYGGYDYLISVAASVCDMTLNVGYPNTFINPVNIFEMSMQAPGGSTSTKHEFVNSNEIVITKGQALFCGFKKNLGANWQGMTFMFLIRKV